MTGTKIFLHSVATSARLSFQMSPVNLNAICTAALSGKTPNEPEAREVAACLSANGYYVGADDMVWGLWVNSHCQDIELIRIGKNPEVR